MTALFCNSNMFVPYVLSLVLSNKFTSYMVMTDQKNIYQFFEEVCLKNVKIAFYPSDFSFISQRKEKKHLLRLFTQEKIKKIFFFHTEYGQTANWLIKKWSSKALVYFASPYDFLSFKKKWSIKALLLTMKYKLLYGYRITPLDDGNGIIPSLSNLFLKEVSAIKESIPINNSLINDFVLTKYSKIISNRKIVLLSGAVKAQALNEKEYEIKQDQIINTIGKNNITIKCHPRFNDLYGLEKKLPSIPSYIPLNILLPLFNCYIGYASTVLVEAATIGKCSISTIYLNNSCNELRDDEMKKYLQAKLNDKGKIYFPHSIEELMNIVKEHYCEIFN